jgi:Flp pilus assembly CpaE family ATPase
VRKVTLERQVLRGLRETQVKQVRRVPQERKEILVTQVGLPVRQDQRDLQETLEIPVILGKQDPRVLRDRRDI